MHQYSLPLFSLACWTLTGFSSVQAVSMPSNSSSSCVKASQWTEVNANSWHFHCIEQAQGVNYSFDCVDGVASGNQTISISSAANNPWGLPGLTWQEFNGPGSLSGGQCAQTYEKFLDLFRLTQVVVDNPTGYWDQDLIEEDGSYYLSYDAQNSKTPLFWCSLNPVPGGRFYLSLGLKKVQSVNTDNISTAENPLYLDNDAPSRWSQIQSFCDVVRANLQNSWNVLMPPACMNPEYWLNTTPTLDPFAFGYSGWQNTTPSCSSWFGTETFSCVVNQNLGVYKEGTSSSEPGGCGPYEITAQNCASCYVNETILTQLKADPCSDSNNWATDGTPQSLYCENNESPSNLYFCMQYWLENEAYCKETIQMHNTYTCNQGLDNNLTLGFNIPANSISTGAIPTSKQCGNHPATPQNCSNCYKATSPPGSNYTVPE